MSSRPNTNLADAIAQGGHMIFYDADWDGYERFSEFFSGLGYGKVAFCDGILEIMGNESLSHEVISRIIAHIIGSYSIFVGREVVSSGSALIGSKEKNAGKNPDESFWFDRKPVEGAGPDLVVEVVVSTEAISKQSFYAKFEVPEFWIWQDGKLSVYLLKADRKSYRRSKSSSIFPELDMKLVEKCSKLSSLNKADALFREHLAD